MSVARNPIAVDARAVGRFERLYAKDASGCWLWIGTLTHNGYGRFRDAASATVPAHRFAYVALVAVLPLDLSIDHLCRVRRCVNPKHLEAVPLKDNILRGECPPAANAKRGVCIRGHAFDVALRADGARFCKTCASMRQIGRYAKDPERSKMHSAAYRERKRLRALLEEAGK